MNVVIREEKASERQVIFNLIKEAFKDEQQSDHKEHYLVDNIRESDAYIPELALVAEMDGVVVGHILYSKIHIVDGDQKVESIALAPVSVLPAYQNKGIGSQLIKKSLQIAVDQGYASVIVLGHKEYYPRFGFKPASNWGITAPFEVPNEYFMALELEEGALENISGVVEYSKPFQ